jgi:uncharacterized protein YbjT (DUF2867 family)
VALIDPRDVAAVAAAVLAQDGHEGRTYTLTGPEAITFGEVASRPSGVLGRPVSYVDVPDGAARGSMLEAGVPAWAAEGIVAVWGQLRAGAASSITDTVRVLTGREPRRIEEFLRDHAGAFA